MTVYVLLVYWGNTAQELGAEAEVAGAFASAADAIAKGREICNSVPHKNNCFHVYECPLGADVCDNELMNGRSRIFAECPCPDGDWAFGPFSH